MEGSQLIIYGLVGGGTVLAAAVFLSMRRVAQLTQDLTAIRRELIDLRAHTTAGLAQLQKELTPIVHGASFQKRSGGGVFTPEMSIAEVMALHPEAEQVLAMFHLGGCSACAVTDEHRLGEAIQEYAIDGEALLAALNNLFEGSSLNSNLKSSSN